MCFHLSLCKSCIILQFLTKNWPNRTSAIVTPQRIRLSAAWRSLICELANYNRRYSKGKNRWARGGENSHGQNRRIRFWILCFSPRQPCEVCSWVNTIFFCGSFGEHPLILAYGRWDSILIIIEVYIVFIVFRFVSPVSCLLSVQHHQSRVLKTSHVLM